LPACPFARTLSLPYPWRARNECAQNLSLLVLGSSDDNFAFSFAAPKDPNTSMNVPHQAAPGRSMLMSSRFLCEFGAFDGYTGSTLTVHSVCPYARVPVPSVYPYLYIWVGYAAVGGGVKTLEGNGPVPLPVYAFRRHLRPVARGRQGRRGGNTDGDG
jgi:hypothetical protein